MPKGKRAEGRASTDKKPRIKRRLITTLCIVFGVPLLLLGLWKIVFRPPPLDEITPPGSAEESGPPSVENAVKPSSEPGDGDEDEVTYPEDIKYDPDIRTVLLTGVYSYANRDTIMIGRLNYKTHELNVVSIPRDTTVYYNGRARKISAVYADGEALSKGGGMDALISELHELLGFKVGSYADVRYKGVERLVDSVGGVEFDLPVDLYKPSEGINLKAGHYKALSGNQAIQLLRYRTYESSETRKAGIPNYDYGRMYMQQQFLKAAAKQLLVPKNITKINEWVEIFKENVTTSLSFENMVWYAEQFFQLDADKITFATLPTKTGSDTGKGYYDYVVADEALVMINELLNPYDRPITRGMVGWYKPF